MKKIHSGNYLCTQSLPKWRYLIVILTWKMEGQNWKKNWFGYRSGSGNCLTSFILLYHKLIKHIWIPKASINTKWYNTWKYLKMGAEMSFPYVLAGVPFTPTFKNRHLSPRIFSKMFSLKVYSVLWVYLLGSFGGFLPKLFLKDSLMIFHIAL